LGDFSPIGRLLKVVGDFLKKKIRPKNGDFLGEFLVCKKSPKIHLIKVTILVKECHF
jgi:hypothetical protein